MLRRKIVVQLNSGLQAQVATEFVRKASLYTSDINILKEGKLAVGKSIMGVMCLAIRKGEEVILIADGFDEQKAMGELGEFLSCN
ncbi:HPr family phosphocarrier protein [Bacillus sp. USDA818B3_A]|uniref:HPr family phosphocarrier protein n=1 Tax=Bacillus sp. USDA818B3_A TaxID=2698834 RepID=UPI0013682E94|nr:HPr family phosphocarrier protein [Bacillus sp. USDA818B3_A]